MHAVYAKNFARRNFAPISPMQAVSEIFYLHSGNIHVIMSARAYAHSNSRAPPTTSRKVTHTIGGIKFGVIFVQYIV